MGMWKKRIHRALFVCGPVLVGAFAGIFAIAAQSGPAPTMAPPMNALSVEPRVPRLSVTPCVVELFRDLRLESYPEPDLNPRFRYTPPADCPGPWAKVILSVDMRGPGTTAVANITIALADERADPNITTELLVAGAQFNDGQQWWRVERDVTDYSALLRDTRLGFPVQTDYYYRDSCGCNAAHMTARLIFYPVTNAFPAAVAPDAVYAVPRLSRLFPAGSLPRNIERAYLDVYAQITWPWFSCVPSDAALTYPILTNSPIAMGDGENIEEDQAQGCGGNSYFDVLVTIDGQPVGTAPLYPWLNSDLNRYWERSVDVPVPTPQSINLMPSRLDLTPFAALLSDGNEHVVEILYRTVAGAFRLFGDEAQLLVYLDHGSQQVTGQVTRNTLVGSTVEVNQVRNAWQLQGDVLQGDVERHYRSAFEIAGFLNTSRGRVDSSVKQEQWLTNVQVVRVDGAGGNASGDNLHTYAQNLDLVSVSERTSRRQRGSTVLALDKERYHYPLQIDYQATGGRVGSPEPYLQRAAAWVLQGHHKLGGYYRPAGTYGERLYANYAGGRAFDALTGVSTQWQGARSHYFSDTAGSCTRERVTWVRDAITSHTQGIGCEDGINRVRGFAHPDGSPNSLNWLR